MPRDGEPAKRTDERVARVADRNRESFYFITLAPCTCARLRRGVTGERGRGGFEAMVYVDIG